MRLSDLQNKDIVNIKEGKRVGKIIDVLIDEQGNMKALIIQRLKLFNLICSLTTIASATLQSPNAS